MSLRVGFGSGCVRCGDSYGIAAGGGGWLVPFFAGADEGRVVGFFAGASRLTIKRSPA